MDSKHYLNVKSSIKPSLINQKQKSFESYDSTSSNYSQISDICDTQLPVQQLETLGKSPSPIRHAISESSNANSQAEIKRSFWQKTVSSFRSYKHKRNDSNRHKSVGCSPNSPSSPASFEIETEDIDPVYHLLRCAASQGKPNKDDFQTNSDNVDNLCTERPRSISNTQFHKTRGICIDSKCPCKYPDKIPVIKKEDLGQQAKKNPISRSRNDELKYSSTGF